MPNRPTLLTQCIALSLLASIVSTIAISNNDDGKLGPLDSITLAGENDITIKNNDGRISWGDKKTSTVWSIGFMETGKALSQLLLAEHFIDARDELNQELENHTAEVRALLNALKEEGSSIDPSSPEAPEFRQKWDQARVEFQRLQNLGAEARAFLIAEQMEIAYNEIVEAVNVVAERMNIDIVLRFIPPDGEFGQGKPDATIMQIRLRSALRLPEGIDITDEVLTELGLELK